MSSISNPDMILVIKKHVKIAIYQPNPTLKHLNQHQLQKFYSNPYQLALPLNVDTQVQSNLINIKRDILILQLNKLKKTQMNKVNKLLQKQSTESTLTYLQLKKDPFPYLQQCNRMQIFQFIHHLQSHHKQLQQKIKEKYPQQTLQDVMKNHKIQQLKKDIIGVHQMSIQNMENQIKSKRVELDMVRKQNQKLQETSKMQILKMKEAQNELIEVQKERRSLQLQLKLNKDKKQDIDTSSLFQNLYKDVRNILQNSI